MSLRAGNQIESQKIFTRAAT